MAWILAPRAEEASSPNYTTAILVPTVIGTVLVASLCGLLVWKHKKQQKRIYELDLALNAANVAQRYWMDRATEMEDRAHRAKLRRARRATGAEVSDSTSVSDTEYAPYSPDCSPRQRPLPTSGSHASYTAHDLEHGVGPWKDFVDDAFLAARSGGFDDEASDDESIHISTPQYSATGKNSEVTRVDSSQGMRRISEMATDRPSSTRRCSTMPQFEDLPSPTESEKREKELGELEEDHESVRSDIVDQGERIDADDAARRQRLAASQRDPAGPKARRGGSTLQATPQRTLNPSPSKLPVRPSAPATRASPLPPRGPRSPSSTIPFAFRLGQLKAANTPMIRTEWASA